MEDMTAAVIMYGQRVLALFRKASAIFSFGLHVLCGWCDFGSDQEPYGI